MSRHSRRGRRWATLRAAYAATLPQPCWRCGFPIAAGAAFDLGHRVDLAHGGTDTQLAVEHPACNRAAGAAAGNRARGLARANARAITASRTW